MMFNFEVVLLNGEKVPDMSKYADAISDILFDTTQAENLEITKCGFSLDRAPTINEILKIEQKLVALGLVIQA